MIVFEDKFKCLSGTVVKTSSAITCNKRARVLSHNSFLSLCASKWRQSASTLPSPTRHSFPLCMMALLRLGERTFDTKSKTSQDIKVDLVTLTEFLWDMSIENFRKISQFMLARGCVKSDEFFDFLNSLRNDGASQLSDETIFASVSNMNQKLKKYNMMIRASTDDKTHEKYYSLISTIDNPITREACHYTPKEFEYFRLIWQVIRDSPLERDRARELANSIKLQNYEELLIEWCEKQWLVHEQQQDKYRIGPRSRAELDVLM